MALKYFSSVIDLDLDLKLTFVIFLIDILKCALVFQCKHYKTGGILSCGIKNSIDYSNKNKILLLKIKGVH